MKIIAIQYLEDNPDLFLRSAGEVRLRLRAALECLPISIVLLGWNLPPSLFEACADETSRNGARLFRWQPLLTGDSTFTPRPEWRTIGLDGEPVPGFRGLPEFTFVCPNRPSVQEAVSARIQQVMDTPIQGIFLDRMRFPSPAQNLARYLACFCPDCQRQATLEGFDLRATQTRLRSAMSTLEGALRLLGQILSPTVFSISSDLTDDLQAFLDFRKRSITRFVHLIAGMAHAKGLEVGLDCLTPAFTQMVGQDLGALDPDCDWIKIMSYGHALGPSGMPFELLCIVGWLSAQFGVGEGEALAFLGQFVQLALPRSNEDLRTKGLAPQVLAGEIRRARLAGVKRLLAGIELVEIKGVAEPNEHQLRKDLEAFKSACADGLALSWDLWYMPLKWLKLVNSAWSE